MGKTLKGLWFFGRLSEAVGLLCYTGLKLDNELMILYCKNVYLGTV
uniref:Uncharacterized protein n=1 Tax=Rhizophora mucronata TaxID=61149 RepID=A0A2P2PTP4_RHIMU